MSATDKFFEESREQSIVKATIVESYFDAWAGIIIGAQKRYPSRSKGQIGYVDLFAGPGRYKDGSISTPLRVLQKAIEKPDYAERLVAVFNDGDGDSTQTLEREIRQLPGIERLKHKPAIWNEDVGDEIERALRTLGKLPILAFIDPWGYRGLTLDLVNRFLRDWGCDCIFFFNYARINAGLSNPLVREHMNALFGATRAARLEATLEPLSPREREATIVNELAEALKQFGHRFVLPFCFKNESGKRTKHHLIFVSKNFKGYDVMKGIMANASSTTEQGVPSFEYAPPASHAQRLLFELNRPLDDLREMLLDHFAGRTLSMGRIYEEHSIDRPFLPKHYKAVLAELERAGAVTTRGRRSNRGFANEIVVAFPRKS